VAITTLAGLKAAMPGQVVMFTKTMTTSANAFMSNWLQNPGAGVTPSSGVAGDIPTDATTGSLGVFVNPSGANTYLGGMEWSNSVTSGLFVLYDRLWQNSGLSTTTTTAQTVNSVALTRPDANGERTEAWFQVYATMGAGTGGTMTLTYTNSGGTASRTATLNNYAAAGVQGRCFQYTLHSGDMGVKSIQNETHTTTLTSGTYGLVIRRRIASVVTTNLSTQTVTDGISLAMPRVYDDACLEFLWMGSSGGVINGSLNLVQG
jgi:hypothetical protein